MDLSSEGDYLIYLSTHLTVLVIGLLLQYDTSPMEYPTY